MEDKKVQQKSEEINQNYDQALTELLFRVSALEQVLIERGIVSREELVLVVKESLKKMVSHLASDGKIRNADVILEKIDKKVSN